MLIALIMVVLLGFLGLAVDGGRAYLDRRELQAGVDAAALAAAYNYMNNTDYAQAERAATAAYASNERLYVTPTCTGYGSTSVSCTFPDATGQALTTTVANHSIAGVNFTVTSSHRIPITIMQIVGAGTSIPVGATATAVARRTGSAGAAIQTLSPACTSSNASLAFTGTSTTSIVGDIWSDGGIIDNGGAGGTLSGDAVAICPNMPPPPLAAPNWNVSGVEANGWYLPDPNFQPPTLNTTTQAWNSTNGSSQAPGTYTAAVSLTSNNCYFMAGGVYDFSGGFKLNGGFVSNELKPPDEPAMGAVNSPNMTTTTAALSGSISSIAVAALPYAVAGSTSQHSSYVSVGGQTFVVGTAGAAAGATSIPLKNGQSASGTIPSGSTLTVRAYNQFWDANQSSPDASGCSASFTPSAVGSDAGNPAVSPQTWSVELTAVRWSPGSSTTSCSGPASPTCYLRESAPSMCKTVTTQNNNVIKIQVTGNTGPPDPGAQYFNVYLAANGTCQAPFGYVGTFQDNGSTPNYTINNSVLSGWAPSSSAALDTSGAYPPDPEQTAMATGLPNANPAAGTPPRGDLANENHCVAPSTGANVACPSAWTAGAVELYIPGPGSNTQCLNLQGGGDIYIYSGYQFGRILLYEPGPQQAPPANTCPNNVAGSGLTSLTGILYTPAAGVTVVGNSSYLATIAGGIISYTATIRGNGGVSITADPTLRPFPSAVRLVQ